MLNRKTCLAVTAIAIASALTALGTTSASATVTANPGHANEATAIVPTVPAVANASTAPSFTNTTPYTICSYNPNPPHLGGLGCISDPGHENVVSVHFNRDTTLNFVDQGTAEGFHWYLLRFNGTNSCLNWSPSTDFVYSDSCVQNDPFEMWASPATYILTNKATYDFLGEPNTEPVLYTCNNTGDSRLVVGLIPSGCSFNQSNLPQYSWLAQAS